METSIYFNNEDQKADRCAQSIYFDFIDYAFSGIVIIIL